MPATRLNPPMTPPATGLMVWARRTDSISHLLAGLSCAELSVRCEAVKSLLLEYYRQTMSLQDAADYLDEIPKTQIEQLTTKMLDLANRYHWE